MQYTLTDPVFLKKSVNWYNRTDLRAIRVQAQAKIYHTDIIR